MIQSLRRPIAALATTSAAVALGAAAVAGSPAAAGSSAADASQGRIVYVCGADLCAIDPGTGLSATITTDARGYTLPSVSSDGSRVAAAIGYQVVAGAYGANLPEVWDPHVEGLNDVAISPDGAAAATSYWYTRLENRYTFPDGLTLVLVHYNAANYLSAAGGAPAGHTGDSGVGFLGTSLLSTDFKSGTWDADLGKLVGSEERICAVRTPSDADATCETVVAIDGEDPTTQRSVNISDPTGSPDGTLIAAVVGLYPEAGGGIVDNPTGESPVIRVFDAATGAQVTQIPGNGTSPTFSPDGSQLAFEGSDGHIYVVPARGGTPVQLVAGTQPTWGGGSIVAPTPTPTPTSTAPAPTTPAPTPTTPGPGPGDSTVPGTVKAGKKPLPVRKKAVRLTITCPVGADAGCAGRARIKVGKKVITATKAYTIAAGKGTRVTLKVTKKGMRALKRNKAVKARVELLGTTGKKPVTTRTIKIRRS